MSNENIVKVQIEGTEEVVEEKHKNIFEKCGDFVKNHGLDIAKGVALAALAGLAIGGVKALVSNSGDDWSYEEDTIEIDDYEVSDCSNESSSTDGDDI